MKKHIYLSCFLIILISCNKKTLQDPLPPKTNNNLKYFGYTLIDVFWDDPTDNSDKTNYIDEIHEFANIADILVVDPTDNIVDRINVFESYNVQAILHLSEIFFEQKSVGGDLSGVIYGLRGDYQERWDTFITTNNLLLNSEKISCLYIGEEPAWNGISEVDFTLACDYAKQTIPNVPILNVEAFAAINQLYTPNSVDYVGFDHYFLKQPSQNSEFQLEYATLKDKMKSHQKIMLIMDAHWIKNFHGSSGISKNDMDFIARDYYNMANQDTSVVGIIGYFWPSGFDFKNSIGARNLPEHILDEHKNIGKVITGK